MSTKGLCQQKVSVNNAVYNTRTQKQENVSINKVWCQQVSNTRTGSAANLCPYYLPIKLWHQQAELRRRRKTLRTSLSGSIYVSTNMSVLASQNSSYPSQTYHIQLSPIQSPNSAPPYTILPIISNPFQSYLILSNTVSLNRYLLSLLFF